eukprot:TRINITY_DN67212_c0_g3_i1.p1 TRINITY_DN67212_c0_g3~~TRINITY_DN67212_c0_g3_i1.p1  ORF type:complete len:555 (-),score=54.09 TRINITY_DN67212_c0_g3_i1:134-1777(-)
MRAFLLLLLVLGCQADESMMNPTVTTPLGKVVGITNNTVDGFLGIPFAEAPVGNLRWKSPVAKGAWAPKTLQATQLPINCMQPYWAPGPMPDSEDCLFLNVFRPWTNTTKSLPVLIFIHGGSFRSGGSMIYPGWHLAQTSQSIVVTVNYRLNVFGFLTLPELASVSSGVNFGIQDQSLAIKWVHQYISHFGGNPNSVTLMGESAGGASVAFHLLNSKSNPQDYFHRVILESPAPTIFATTGTNNNAGKFFARKAGCHDASSRLSCLRGLNTSTIWKAYEATTHFAAFGGIPGFVDMVPSVDGATLEDSPALMFSQGRFNLDVPTIVGSNLHEGRLFTGKFFNIWPETAMNVSQSTFENALLKIGFVYELNATKAFLPVYTNQVKLMTAEGNKQVYYDVVNLMVADAITHCFIQHIVDGYTSWSNTHVYQYLFTGYLRNGTLNIYGSTHSSELPFVFDNVETPWGIEEHVHVKDFSPANRKLANEIENFWMRFIHSGAPGGMWSARTKGNYHNVMQLAPTGLVPDDTVEYKTCWAWEGAILRPMPVIG